MSKASEAFYGYSKAEALGKNLIDLIIPAGMQDEVQQAFQSRTDSAVSLPSDELTLLHKDGSPVEVFASHSLVMRNGNIPELRFLIANGCDAMQGYLFSKPLPAGEFEQLMGQGACLNDLM